MNLANLNTLIEKLESVPDEKFVMEFFFQSTKTGKGVSRYTHCKTAACIAGWAYTLTPKNERTGDWFDPFGSTAAEWLGLHYFPDAHHLFKPEGFFDSTLFPRARAIDVLKHLRATSKVEWSKFPAENYKAEGKS